MSEKRYLFIRFVVLICLFVALGSNIKQFIPFVPMHTDEVSWFFHIDAFKKAVIEKDITSDFWQSYESYDHPPLVKYIYGVYMWTRDAHVFMERDVLEHEWGRWAIYTNAHFIDEGFPVFRSYILRLRDINWFALMGTLVGFYVFLVTFYVHWVVAMTGVIFLAHNSLFLQEMIHATSDAYMVCFMIWSLVLYMVGMQKKNDALIYAAFFLSAASVSSKLSGIVSCIVLCTYKLAQIISEERKRKNMAIQTLLMVCVIFGVWVAINPTLYTAPIKNTILYATFRIDQTQRIAYLDQDSALPDIASRVRAVWCTLVQHDCVGFFEKGTFTVVFGINALLILGGLFYLFQHSASRHKERLLVFIFLFVTIVWTTWFIPLHYGRYYLPIQIGVFFISTCGIETIRLITLQILKNKTPVFRRGIFDKTS